MHLRSQNQLQWDFAQHGRLFFYGTSASCKSNHFVRYSELARTGLAPAAPVVSNAEMVAVTPSAADSEQVDSMRVGMDDPRVDPTDETPLPSTVAEELPSIESEQALRTSHVITENIVLKKGTRIAGPGGGKLQQAATEGLPFELKSDKDLMEVSTSTADTEDSNSKLKKGTFYMIAKDLLKATAAQKPLLIVNRDLKLEAGKPVKLTRDSQKKMSLALSARAMHWQLRPDDDDGPAQSVEELSASDGPVKRPAEVAKKNDDRFWHYCRDRPVLILLVSMSASGTDTEHSEQPPARVAPARKAEDAVPEGKHRKTGDLAALANPLQCELACKAIECDDISALSPTPRSVVDEAGRSGSSFVEFVAYLARLALDSRPKFILVECVANLAKLRKAVQEQGTVVVSEKLKSLGLALREKLLTLKLTDREVDVSLLKLAVFNRKKPLRQQAAVVGSVGMGEEELAMVNLRDHLSVSEAQELCGNAFTGNIVIAALVAILLQMDDMDLVQVYDNFLRQAKLEVGNNPRRPIAQKERNVVKKEAELGAMVWPIVVLRAAGHMNALPQEEEEEVNVDDTRPCEILE
ncbi:unnamed protein product [Effrenium voratum]|nr:unnamed protein product [Effrenium voratum]